MQGFFFPNQPWLAAFSAGKQNQTDAAAFFMADEPQPFGL